MKSGAAAFGVGLAIIAAAPAMAGTAFGSPDRPKADAAVRAAHPVLDGELRDYPSARFRNVHVVKIGMTTGPEYWICGEVNAKNAYGAYTGWAAFAVSPGGPVTYRDPGDVLWTISGCGRPPDDAWDSRDLSGLLAAPS